MECPVCCQTISKSQIYSIGNCSHKFCKNCVLQHIKARLQLFQTVNCLSNNCHQKLTQNSAIFKQLSNKDKQKYYKLQQFIIIQQNSKLKPCQIESCLGIIDISTNNLKSQLFIECQTCHTKHCIFCYELPHTDINLCPKKQQNKNNINKDDQIMAFLHYKKCPNCSAWVERNGGCQYVICKCKTQFCYSCGQLFKNDPCRKLNISNEQIEIRKLAKLSKLFKKMPQKSLFQRILFFPLLIMKLILIFLFTLIGGISLMAILFGLFIAILYFVSPAGIFIMLGDSEITNSTRAILRILTVLLYPLVGLGVAVGAFIVMATYPFMRLIYATHLYDEMDNSVQYISVIYLKGIHCIGRL